jgi:sirohydrochlorin ferrochelatase
MNSPILIACAHGTSNAQGAAEVNALRDAIAALRPGLDVREAYVDVQQPDLVDVVAGLPAGSPRGPPVASRGPPVPPPSSFPCC